MNKKRPQHIMLWSFYEKHFIAKLTNQESFKTTKGI